MSERYDASFSQVFSSAVQAFSSIVNTATGEGTSMDKTVHTEIQGPTFLSRDQIRGLISNVWVAQKAVVKPVQNALRRGVKLAFEDQEALASDVKAEMEALDVWKHLFDGLCAARAFGGAAILLLTEDERASQGAEYDPSRPLRDEDGSFFPGIKRLAGLYMIEGGRDCNLRPATLAPAWAKNGEPVKLNDWRPGRYFGKPIWYEWNPEPEDPVGDDVETPEGLIIHRDRLIFLPSGVFTDKETKKVLGGWSLGILDAAVLALTRYESSQTSVVNIIYDFFTVIAKVKDFKKIVTSGEVDKLIERFMANALARSVLHMWVCDANDEDITKEGAPVAGLEGLLDKLMDGVAGAVHMPRSILFNEAPKSGGRDEAGQKSWEEDIESLREHGVAPAIRTIIDVLVAAEQRPAEIRAFSVGFEPLQRPTVKEAAEAFRTLAHADEINVKGGIYTRKEARSRHMGVGEIVELKLEGDEPPDEAEFLKLAQATSPGFQREAGQNTESQGKVPNSGAKR